MNTSLRPRIQVLQDLVLAYFRSYEKRQLAEVVEKPQLGAVEIAMTGLLATRFETLTVPHPSRLGYRLLRLLLDPQYAAVAHGYDTIAPRSHLMRLIKNDLSGESGYARSTALVNLDGTFEDLLAMGVSIAHVAPAARAAYPLRRFYLVTILFRQSGSEQNEDSIRVVVDAETKKPLPEVAAARFADLTLVDASETPPEYHLDQLPRPKRTEAEQALEVAIKCAQERARLVAQQRVNTEVRKQAQERGQIERLHQAELRNAMPARRGEVEASLQHSLDGLDRRYTTHSELTLLSLQEVLVPLVQYTLLVNGKPFPQRFQYDPLDNRVATSFCPNCGEHADALEWAYCGRGHHCECAHCDTVRPCSEPGCARADCSTHAVRCASCSKQLCPDHEVACQYCRGLERYCTRHIAASFEKEPICPSCSRECQACSQLFPPAHVAECNVCGATICSEDQLECPGCQLPFCKDTTCGAAVAGHTERYCHLCQEICVQCGVARSHYKDDLVSCGECGNRLCGAHRQVCTNCRKVLCDNCKLNTAQGSGCSTCYAPCQTCQAQPPVLRKDLQHCRLCPEGDSGLHCTEAGHAVSCRVCRRHVCNKHRIAVKDGGIACRTTSCAGQCHQCKQVFTKQRMTACAACKKVFCPDHHRTCALCGNPFCESDRQTLADGRISCRGCAAACDLCGKWHERSSVRACRACGRTACADHHQHSEFRDEDYCTEHAQQFAECPGCVRRGPAEQLAVCSCCMQPYCPHCRPQEVCEHCRGISPTELSEQVRAEWAARLEGTARPSEIDEKTWTTLREALGRRTGHYRFANAATPRLDLLRASFQGGWLGFITRNFCKVRSFVLAWSTNKSSLTIRVNP